MTCNRQKIILVSGAQPMACKPVWHPVCLGLAHSMGDQEQAAQAGPCPALDVPLIPSTTLLALSLSSPLQQAATSLPHPRGDRDITTQLSTQVSCNTKGQQQLPAGTMLPIQACSCGSRCFSVSLPFCSSPFFSLPSPPPQWPRLHNTLTVESFSICINKY